MIYGNIGIQNVLESISIAPEMIMDCRIDDYFTEASIQSKVVELNEKMKKTPIMTDPVLRNKIEQVSNKIANLIKIEGVNKNTSNSISTIIQDFYQDCSDAIDNVARTNFSIYGGDKDRFGNSYKANYLFCWVLIISFIGQTVFTILFGMQAGTLISVILLAPIIEESSKAIAIKGGYSDEYFKTFNMFEFTMYFFQLAPVIGVAKTIIARSLAVGMHYTTTIVQKKFADKKFQEKLGLDSKTDRDKINTMGLTCGMIIHGLWNAIACIV